MNSTATAIWARLSSPSRWAIAFNGLWTGGSSWVKSVLLPASPSLFSADASAPCRCCFLASYRGRTPYVAPCSRLVVPDSSESARDLAPLGSPPPYTPPRRRPPLRAEHLAARLRPHPPQLDG